MKTLVYVVLCISCSMSRKVEYCFADRVVTNFGFGAKTAYRFVSNGRLEKPSILNCRASQIWMLSRHGTRYPDRSAINRLQELTETRRQIIESHEINQSGNLCDKDLEKLKTWYPDIHLRKEYANQLTPEGWHEGKELGKRLRKAYPELLQVGNNNIPSDDYIFQSMEEERCQSSMDALIEGLFGGEFEWESPSIPETNAVLQPDTTCANWVPVQESARHQREEFINGVDYAELRYNVSRRLGFEVSPGTIHNMQDMCRFETAWMADKSSAWCSVFSKNEWEILEYIDDLHYYYLAGYGCEINSQLGCSPLQDLYRNFRIVQEGKSNGEPKGIFYFTDSQFLLHFLNSLGISRDMEHLSARNFKGMAGRKWKTSIISPFFSNFIATLHRCNNGMEYKVTFHLNEKLVEFENCPGGICDWWFLKRKFERLFETCRTKCDDEREEMLSMDYADVLLLIIMIVVMIFSLRTVIVNRLFKISVKRLHGDSLKLRIIG